MAFNPEGSLLEGSSSMTAREQVSMNKTKSAQKQTASKSKTGPAKGKRQSAGKSRAVGAKARTVTPAQPGTGATAPVVYNTLRERIEAVDSNVGTTLPLSDFLKSSGWS
jgi:sorbitol-specific phosphotransferase system component IIBC